MVAWVCVWLGWCALASPCRKRMGCSCLNTAVFQNSFITILGSNQHPNYHTSTESTSSVYFLRIRHRVWGIASGRGPGLTHMTGLFAAEVCESLTKLATVDSQCSIVLSSATVGWSCCRNWWAFWVWHATRVPWSMGWWDFFFTGGYGTKFVLRRGNSMNGDTASSQQEKWHAS